MAHVHIDKLDLNEVRYPVQQATLYWSICESKFINNLAAWFAFQRSFVNMRDLSRNHKFTEFRPSQFQHVLVDQTEFLTLHINNIYSLTESSFRTLGQGFHKKVPRTKCYANIAKYREFI